MSATPLSDKALENVSRLSKVIPIVLVVGVLFYLGFLYALWGFEDRLPKRFVELRLPKNIFLYLRLASLVLFLLLVPSYLFLLKIRKRLNGIRGGSESDLNAIWADFKSLMMALIIPWLIYSFVMLGFGYRIMKMAFTSF